MYSFDGRLLDLREDERILCVLFLTLVVKHLVEMALQGFRHIALIVDAMARLVARSVVFTIIINGMVRFLSNAFTMVWRLGLGGLVLYTILEYIGDTRVDPFTITPIVTATNPLAHVRPVPTRRPPIRRSPPPRYSDYFDRPPSYSSIPPQEDTREIPSFTVPAEAGNDGRIPNAPIIILGINHRTVEQTFFTVSDPPNPNEPVGPSPEWVDLYPTRKLSSLITGILFDLPSKLVMTLVDDDLVLSRRFRLHEHSTSTRRQGAILILPDYEGDIAPTTTLLPTLVERRGSIHFDELTSRENWEFLLATLIALAAQWRRHSTSPDLFLYTALPDGMTIPPDVELPCNVKVCNPGGTAFREDLPAGQVVLRFSHDVADEAAMEWYEDLRRKGMVMETVTRILTLGRRIGFGFVKSDKWESKWPGWINVPKEFREDGDAAGPA